MELHLRNAAPGGHPYADSSRLAPRAVSRLPAWRRVRATALLALAAGLPMLSAPASVSAQTTTIWSATLTVDVKTVQSVQYAGCNDTDVDHDNCSSVISERDSFTYSGVNYGIKALYISGVPGSQYDLTVVFRKTIPVSVRNALTLHVGSKQFALSSSSSSWSGQNKEVEFAESGLGPWTDGQPVSLKLAADTVCTKPEGFGADIIRPAKPEGFWAAADDGSLTLRWSDPSDDTITCYQYQIKEARTARLGWKNIPNSGAATTSHTIDDLDNGTAYTVRIRAIDNGGAGAASKRVRATPGAPASSNALTAHFVEPVRHLGKWQFIVEIKFSEPVTIRGKTGAKALEVTGGKVTRARRAEGADWWELRVKRDSQGPVTLRLPVTTDCGAPGAVCTADGRKLSSPLSLNVPLVPGLRVSNARVQEGPNATADFRVTLSRVATGPVTVDYATEDGTATAGKDYTTTSGTLTFQAGETEKTVSVPVLDDAVDEGKETFTLRLSNARGARRPDNEGAGTITPGAPASSNALTARVAGPAKHLSKHWFVVRITFSEPVTIRAKTGAKGLQVTDGTVYYARREGGADRWTVLVKRSSQVPVTLTLPVTTDCGAKGAVCTADGRKLSQPLSLTVPLVPGLRVSNARAQEGPDATIDFRVTLSRAATGPVTVDYETEDGTAKAGEDYRRTTGSLAFEPGETEKTVSVQVLDDAVDEGKETFTLRLSNARGARLADSEGTGTIKNADPLPRAWLARFGRTVGTHVTDAVGERLRGAPGQDSHVTIGGSRLPLGQRKESDQPSVLEAVAGLLGMGGTGAGTPATGFSPPDSSDPRLGQGQSVNIDLRQLLLGSSFRLALGAADADSSSPRLTAWGRFAGTTFDGQDGDLTVDGDVFTGTVGVDGTWDRLLAGVAVAHSRGDGSFTMPGTEDRGRGDLEQTLTSLHPYLRYAVTDRLDVWGLVGYGWGQLDLEMADGVTYETDTTLVMGAFGSRGILLAAADTGGFQLATRTDAMLTRTSSDAIAGLVSSDADAHRVRLVLEGSRGVTWADGRSLTPTVELGLRHDWGDAETGFGLEVGGRVQYADPTLGLTVEGTVRGLLAHEDSDYQEWGASGTIRLAPGAGGQGLALTIAPTWGVASSGVEGLWARQTTAGLAPPGRTQPQAGRLTAEVGYGVAAFDVGLLTPYGGVTLVQDGTQQYRLGGRLAIEEGLNLNLEGAYQQQGGQTPADTGLLLRLEMPW